MALFKSVVEAFIASPELDPASLSRLAFWTDTLGDREVADITPEDVDQALGRLADAAARWAAREPPRPQESLWRAPRSTVNSAGALIDLVHALKAKCRTGAVWLMNSATAGVVRKLKDNDAGHVWVNSLINGQPSLLLGYPVEIDDSMPDIAAGT